MFSYILLGKRSTWWSSLFLLLPFIGGCDGPEQAPAYIIIDGLEETSSGFDAAALAITEVWVFANGTFLGAYDLPARVPVLLQGPVNIEVQMGIRANGINETPDTYPFYTTVANTLDLVPGNTYSLGTLPVTYNTRTNFAIREDFEPSQSRVFTQILTGTRGLQTISEGAFEGSGAGRIVLDADNPIVELLSSELYSDLANPGGGDVWLEVSYLTEVPVVWGVVGDEPGQGLQRFYDPGFRANSSWQKIYFNLTPAVVFSRLAAYNFGLFAAIDGNNQTEATILLDNIRVLYTTN